MKVNKKNNLIKKLLYQTRNRGYKETCIILSKFSEQYLSTLTLQELEDFAIILEQNDSDLYKWIIKNSPYPEKLNHKLMNLLINNI